MRGRGVAPTPIRGAPDDNGEKGIERRGHRGSPRPGSSSTPTERVRVSGGNLATRNAHFLAVCSIMSLWDKHLRGHHGSAPDNGARSLPSRWLGLTVGDEDVAAVADL